MVSLLPVARSNCGASSSSADVSATDVSTLISTGSAAPSPIIPIDDNSNPAAAAANVLVMVVLPETCCYMLGSSVAHQPQATQARLARSTRRLARGPKAPHTLVAVAFLGKAGKLLRQDRIAAPGRALNRFQPGGQMHTNYLALAIVIGYMAGLGLLTSVIQRSVNTTTTFTSGTTGHSRVPAVLVGLMLVSE